VPQPEKYLAALDAAGAKWAVVVDGSAQRRAVEASPAWERVGKISKDHVAFRRRRAGAATTTKPVPMFAPEPPGGTPEIPPRRDAAPARARAAETTWPGAASGLPVPPRALRPVPPPRR